MSKDIDETNYRRVSFTYYFKNDSSLDTELEPCLFKLLKDAGLTTDNNLKLKVDNDHQRIYTLSSQSKSLIYMIDKYDNSYSGSLFSEIPDKPKVSKEEAEKKIIEYLEKRSGS